MDASLRSKAEQLASEIASQAETAKDLNGLMRLMMKSALERMLDTEMDLHLGRKGSGTDAEAESKTPSDTSAGRRTPRIVHRIAATVARRKRCEGTWAN